MIQGLVTFFLYLFPAVFGALADRYGYKRMFLASYWSWRPPICCLQPPTDSGASSASTSWWRSATACSSRWSSRTVAKTTTEKTGTMGFGIFYMMVNIGGFLGPIVAGVVRGWGWNYVF